MDTSPPQFYAEDIESWNKKTSTANPEAEQAREKIRKNYHYDFMERKSPRKARETVDAILMIGNAPRVSC